MSYTPTTWAAGDTVTAAKLNKLEQGVASSGGVLVVNMSAGTLDKTWEEISDAVSEKPVLIIFVNGYTTTVLHVVSVTRPNKVGMKYYVKAFSPLVDFASSQVNFAADTYDGYPVVQE